jgi:hypothetical protein
METVDAPVASYVLVHFPCSYHKHKIPTWGTLYILRQGLYFEQNPFQEGVSEREFISFEDVDIVEKSTTFIYLNKAVCVKTKTDRHFYFINFENSADTIIIIKYFWENVKSKIREDSNSTDKDERTEKLVHSLKNSLQKGSATLDSLKRQEEIEIKMEQKLETIDYHMKLSDRLLRSISSFGGTVRNIVTYYKAPSDPPVHKEEEVKAICTTFKYQDTYPILSKMDNSNLFNNYHLVFVKNMIEIIDSSSREVLYKFTPRDVTSIQDKGTPFHFSINLGNRSLQVVSLFAYTIKQRITDSNDLIEYEQSSIQTIDSLGLHAKPLLPKQQATQTARDKNIQQLSDVLGDLKTVSTVMGTALNDSNKRLDSLLDHVEDTNQSVQKTTDNVNMINKSFL